MVYDSGIMVESSGLRVVEQDQSFTWFGSFQDTNASRVQGAGYRVIGSRFRV